MKDNERPKLCTLLRLRPHRRTERTLLLQTLCGCSWINPHNYVTSRSNCRFCQKDKANLGHLLFECPSRKTELSLKIELNLKNIISKSDKPGDVASARNSLYLFEKLRDEKDFAGMTNFAYGLASSEDSNENEIGPTRHKKTLFKIIHATAAELYGLRAEWLAAGSTG